VALFGSWYARRRALDLRPAVPDRAGSGHR
jgi:hypothetical protein